jgi:hypothetical protein
MENFAAQCREMALFLSVKVWEISAVSFPQSSFAVEGRELLGFNFETHIY